MFHLIFATNNTHKVEEVRAVLGTAFTLETMREAGIDIDIPEPHDTLEANALEKARTIWKLTGKDCFSEDTGLEVEALNGEPGVRSARYAGDDRSPRANINKLLARLGSGDGAGVAGGRATKDGADAGAGAGNRVARFRTVIALILDGQEYLFEGACPGHILEAVRGEGGFGYDPVFVPDGADRTFAEMSLEEKSRFSHRRKAMDQLTDFLKKQPDGQNKD
jgi:XTP/dITP diphosphohydrolase